MEFETEAALRDSIAHWERLASGTSGENEGIYADNCALCGLFIQNECNGCPVKEYSGFDMCQNAPWEDAERALDRAHDDKRSPAFIKAAARQLEFLKNLLPENDHD